MVRFRQAQLVKITVGVVVLCVTVVSFMSYKAPVEHQTDTSTTKSPTPSRSQHQAKVTRPNIVFMMADDLGYGDVHYNGGRARTPHLDDMAKGAHSVLLQRYYSAAPVCSPTRGSVLTGRNPNRYCVWTANAANNNCGDFQCPHHMPLPTSELTVAEILRDAGYHTAVFGKWHLGDFRPHPEGNRKWPVSHPGLHGFDEWWTTERSVSTFYPNCACFNKSSCFLGHYLNPPSCTNYITVDSEVKSLRSFHEPIIEDDSQFIFEQFKGFLEKVSTSDKPFFAYLPFHTPHNRFIASEHYSKLYQSAGYTSIQSDYYGAISAMDQAVGSVRSLLKQYQLSNNTMVWFTSDNGPEHNTPGSSGGLRGGKRNLYEGGIRVPGIIEWPAVIQRNQMLDLTVSSNDFLPTVCDIINFDYPGDKDLDGSSILPFVTGELIHEHSHRESMFWAFNINGDFSGEFNAAVISDKYKLHANLSKQRIVHSELYDLLGDPYETEDIASSHTHTVNSMRSELLHWLGGVLGSARNEVGCLGHSVHIRCKCRNS